jgi:poly(A) polymerase
VKLPPAPWQNRPGMAELLAALSAETGETRYVGGCVRDTLLKLEARDVDLATRLAPEEVIRRLKAAKIKAVPTGLAHGTVTAVVAGQPVEVTTLRRDVSTDGRRATIEYTDDWKKDAGRRDFTINALSADPASGTVHDYFGGLADLKQGRVRFIGEALRRIAEDHLRILRFFRFHARFGRGEADTEALQACTARANDLMALSRERIADELLKILALPDPAPTVALMAAHGIFAPVLPEIDSQGVERLRFLILREQAAAVAPDGPRRLGALLPQDPAVAVPVATRLRMSNAIRLRIGCIAAPAETARPDALAYRVGAECAVDRILLDEQLADAEAAAAIASLAEWKKPRLPVRGGALIARGLPAGPIVAATMQAIERDWIEQGFPDAEALEPAIAARVAQALRDTQ